MNDQDFIADLKVILGMCNNPEPVDGIKNIEGFVKMLLDELQRTNG